MSARPDATRTRILDATYGCLADVGLAATTVEEAARRAGVSRATVYRHFPGGREELLQATIDAEVDRFFLDLRDAVAATPDFAAMLVEGLVFARCAVEGHDVLQRVLAAEPQQLVPQLADSAARVRPLVAAFLAPYLEQVALRPGVEQREAADYLARMILSYLGTSGSWDLTDRTAVAELVRTEFLSGIARVDDETGSALLSHADGGYRDR